MKCCYKYHKHSSSATCVLENKARELEEIMCDLQGIRVGSEYKFSDPVIHSMSGGSGKDKSYGSTDKGIKGIRQFFDTHRCGRVCEVLGLTDYRGPS